MTGFYRVYIGTNGRGIFYGDVDGLTNPITTTSAVVSTTTVATTGPTGTVTEPTPSTTSAVANPWGQCGGTIYPL